MNSAAVHTGSACIRLVSFLCVAVGCNSLTCGIGTIFSPSTYSPIVTGFTCEVELNGQYTHTGQYGAGDLYTNSNGMVLLNAIKGGSYIFADKVWHCGTSWACPSGYTLLARTEAVVSHAGGIPSTILERCFIGTMRTFTPRYNSFNPNPVPASCVCDKGWQPWVGGIAGTCLICENDMYKPEIGNASCLRCPAYSHSNQGSTALSACRCWDGYTGENGGMCTPCGAGTYKPSGTAVCLPCPAFSNSPNASGTLSDCTCNAGFTGNNGGTCTVCGINTYKQGSGSAACLPCHVSSSSSEGSATCACSAGYGAQSGAACTACVPGKYRGPSV